MAFLNFLNLRQTPQYAPPVTFKTKVGQFWAWFSSQADLLDKTFSEKNPGKLDIPGLVNPKMTELIDGVAWCFGAAMDSDGHHLAFSPEGDKTTLLLTQYCVEHAPKIKRWEFYPAKPGYTNENLAINMFNETFQFRDIQVSLIPSDKKGVPDITLHHPDFHKLNADQKTRLCFIVLDEVLGELGTEAWVGTVETSDTPLSAHIPLYTLFDKLDRFYQVINMKKPDPLAIWATYELNLPQEEQTFPQSDCFVKTSGNHTMVTDYFDSKGDFTDPTLNEGAALIYLAIPAEWFPANDPVATRGKVEDAIETSLKINSAGKCIGGGMGTRFGYSDFIIFDGMNSVRLIQEAAKRFDLPKGSHIGFFDKSMRKARFDCC